MDYKQMTAPCGLDCFNCSIYLMQVHGNDPRKNIVLRFLSNTLISGVSGLFRNSKSETIRKMRMLSRAMKIPKDQPICNGCRAENGCCKLHDLPGGCRVYGCSKEMKVDFCFQCDDFPCDYLHPYADMASSLPHNTKVFNLCLIKKMGLEAWAEEKAKKVNETYLKSEWTL